MDSLYKVCFYILANYILNHSLNYVVCHLTRDYMSVISEMGSVSLFVPIYLRCVITGVFVWVPDGSWCTRHHEATSVFIALDKLGGILMWEVEIALIDVFLSTGIVGIAIVSRLWCHSSGCGWRSCRWRWMVAGVQIGIPNRAWSTRHHKTTTVFIALNEFIWIMMWEVEVAFLNVFRSAWIVVSAVVSIWRLFCGI